MALTIPLVSSGQPAGCVPSQSVVDIQSTHCGDGVNEERDRGSLDDVQVLLNSSQKCGVLSDFNLGYYLNLLLKQSEQDNEMQNKPEKHLLSTSASFLSNTSSPSGSPPGNVG